jgi:hypothetical protein
LHSWRHPTEERGGDVLVEPFPVVTHHEFLLISLVQQSSRARAAGDDRDPSTRESP